MPWDPFEEMRGFQRRMNRAFEAFFSRPGMKRFSLEASHPASDVIDRGDHVVVRIDLPGVDKEDIILNITGGSVEVRAQRKQEVKVQKKGYYKHERSYGGFYRVIPLQSAIDPGTAKASYKNGVLEVRIQKSKAKKVSKKVRVE